MSAAPRAGLAARRLVLRAWAALLLLLLQQAALCGAKKRPVSQRLFKSHGRYSAIVQEMASCNVTDIPSQVLVLQNYSQHFGANGDPFVNGMVKVYRSMKMVVKAKITFTKCTEEGTICEPVLVLRPTTDSCEMWQKQNVFWTPLVNSMWSTSSSKPHHPWCPVEEDFWAIRNATFDLDRFARMCPFTLTNSVWDIRLEGWDQDLVLWICVHVRAKIIRYNPRSEAGHD